MALCCIFLLFIILTILVYLLSAGGFFLLGREYLVMAWKEEDYGVLSKGGLKKASVDFLISITQEAMIVFVAYTSDSGHI